MMPDAAQILTYWRPWLLARGFDDMDCPRCWRCDRPARVEGRGRGHTEAELWSNARGLERCHIVPRALGGSDAPDNIVLLCGSCHAVAPDVRERELFMLWLSSETPRWYEALFREAEEAIRAFVPEEQIEKFATWFLAQTPADLGRYCADVGIHFDQHRGPTIKVASFVAVLWQEFRSPWGVS
jgi:hypothetical protein